MLENINWKEIKKGWVAVDHKVHGVTAEMLDWWWVNLDKGYVLWDPVDHKAFEWIIPPPKEHPNRGSIHIAVESIWGGPVMRLQMQRVDPHTLPEAIRATIIYKHCTATAAPDEKNPKSFLSHQYEATSYGARLRSSLYPIEPRPPESIEAWIKHNKREIGRFQHFLPELYKLWQVVKNLDINRQASFNMKP